MTDLSDVTQALQQLSELDASALDGDASNARKPRPLGQTLVERGLLTEDQLRIALLEQKRQGIALGKLLVTLGFVTEDMLRDALSENLGFEQIDLSRLVPNPRALKLVPSEFAKRHHIFPVVLEEEETPPRLIVASATPNDVVMLDLLHSLLGGKYVISSQVAGEGEITHAIDTFYGHELSIDGILHEIETGEVDLSMEAANSRDYSGPVVRLVDALLSDAVLRRSSDIHFEPEQGFVRIRYRIDGVLRQIRALHSKYWPAMLVRIKIMAGMNIAEARAPQDGRISLVMAGRHIDFRAAAQPTLHGENVVLRILDRARALVSLETLGLRPDQLELMETMIARPEGILLVTGPTGSGKTTTLYSILTRLNKEGVNIMTLEDPVEYPMPMIRQSNLAAGLKLDFASGIRSLMRQDPDIILVGEIRDADTATMALRAAMTGHQVYSTLHTNSALGALARLEDLGLKPELLAGNLIGIVGQRLVRRLCTHCKEPYDVEPEVAALLNLEHSDSRTLYRAVGCAHCEQQGYRGRLSLLEVLRFNDELDDMVARHQPLREITQAARRSGFRTLAEDALRRVREGVTSLEEAARVVDLTSLNGSGGP